MNGVAITDRQPHGFGQLRRQPVHRHLRCRHPRQHFGSFHTDGKLRQEHQHRDCRTRTRVPFHQLDRCGQPRGRQFPRTHTRQCDGQSENDGKLLQIGGESTATCLQEGSSPPPAPCRRRRSPRNARASNAVQLTILTNHVTMNQAAD